MKILFAIIIAIIGFLLFSCGGNSKQNQSNISSTVDEEKQFALNLYGDEVKTLIRGDLLNNSKPSAVVGVVRKETSGTWWVQKASFIQKEKDKWQVLLKIEEKLSSIKGELVSQVEAKTDTWLVSILQKNLF
jgi:hypothetical protein